MTDSRLPFIKFCATCDHPEGDHTGTATMWGPRSGSCCRANCDCRRFLLPDKKEAAA